MIAWFFRPAALVGRAEIWDTEGDASVYATEAFLWAVVMGRHIVGPDPVTCWEIQLEENADGVRKF
jgi:hypothetical protein